MNKHEDIEEIVKCLNSMMFKLGKRSQQDKDKPELVKAYEAEADELVQARQHIFNALKIYNTYQPTIGTLWNYRGYSIMKTGPDKFTLWNPDKSHTDVAASLIGARYKINKLENIKPPYLGA